LKKSPKKGIRDISIICEKIRNTTDGMIELNTFLFPITGYLIFKKLLYYHHFFRIGELTRIDFVKVNT